MSDRDRIQILMSVCVCVGGVLQTATGQELQGERIKGAGVST